LQVEELIEPYGPRLWRLCRRLAGCAEEAEELYQQTFLRALECEKRLDREGNPGAWLCTTAAGLWKSSLRRTARRAAIAPMVPEEEGGAVSGGPTPEETLLRRERAQRAALLLDALEEKYRLPLVLHYSGGLAVEEIAAALRLPVGTVKSRMARGRAKIKEGWEAWSHE
jgi:RNA polymerase sigma-70 factor (ECF subfamily)